MATFSELHSGCALVCHKDHRCEAGVGTVWSVLLADGFLIDCGHGEDIGYGSTRKAARRVVDTAIAKATGDA